MYIRDILKGKDTVISLEIFPPKKDVPPDGVISAARELKKIGPDFVSITYGAGGSNTDNSMEISSFVQNELDLTAMAHLTCVGTSKQGIKDILTRLKENNIKNILALRGDYPEGYDKERADYTYAYQLAEDIKEFGGFCIGGACYPEAHPDSPGKDFDIEKLKQKIESGVDFLTTQFFFDNNVLYNFLYRAAVKGITVPVVAGVMPVTNAASVKKMCKMSGATITPKLQAIIEKYGDKPLSMKQAGIAYATEQIIDLMANGVQGIHIYTMNKPEIAKSILNNISDIRKGL